MAVKTFDPVPVDQLNSVKREGVQRMRASLLSCFHEDGSLSSRAINQITAMRIYHQVARIIKYLDIMDKLEDKLYESIEKTLDTCDSADPDTLELLLKTQERLQKSMIESHKLLQPYMELQDMSVVDLMSVSSTVDTASTGGIKILSPESRDKLRVAARAAVDSIGEVPPVPPDVIGGDSGG